LVKCGGVHYELRGGDELDLAAAREWAAHFLHEAFIERTHPTPCNGDLRDQGWMRNHH